MQDRVYQIDARTWVSIFAADGSYHWTLHHDPRCESNPIQVGMFYSTGDKALHAAIAWVAKIARLN